MKLEFSQKQRQISKNYASEYVKDHTRYGVMSNIENTNSFLLKSIRGKKTIVLSLERGFYCTLVFVHALG